MKLLLFLLSFLFLSVFGYSQNDTLAVSDTNTYRILKTDGGEIIGKILSQDAREVFVIMRDGSRIYIPQYIIKEIVIVNESDFNNKDRYVGEDKFATRYFLTTNGLSIKRGEHYVQWNLFGPDLQFAVGKNFGVGVMTSWLGIPIIGTIKKSWNLGKKVQFAIGGLVGTGSYAALAYGGALPFGTVSFGDRTKNVAISGGYGAIWNNGNPEGRALTSVAGVIKVSPKISLVFDSFILLPGKSETITTTYQVYALNPSTGYYEYQTRTRDELITKPGFALFMPGIRWHQAEGKAIQFGFAGMYRNGDILPVPIPMVQWYRSL